MQAHILDEHGTWMGVTNGVQSYQWRLVAVSHLDQLFKQKNIEQYLLGFTPNQSEQRSERW